MGRYCFFRVAARCRCCLRLLLCDVRTIEIFVVAFLDVGQVHFRSARLCDGASSTNRRRSSNVLVWLVGSQSMYSRWRSFTMEMLSVFKMDAAIIAVRLTASCSVFGPVATLAVDARWRCFAWV